jgi:hypothetical protein
VTLISSSYIIYKVAQLLLLWGYAFVTASLNSLRYWTQIPSISSLSIKNGIAPDKAMGFA